MGKVAIIIANGEITAREIIQERLAGLGDTTVIAVDGGSVNCQALGLEYDVVIGDLDSLENDQIESLHKSGVEVVDFPADKDETDLELALRRVVDQGVREIILLAATGGRLDMSVSNVFLLAHPRLQGMKAEIWHGNQTAWLIRPPGEDIVGQIGDTLSLIPLGSIAEGITTHNMKYSLNDDDLDLGSARGISNVLKETNARITLRQGMLLAIHTPGRA